jgi:hypothetical protein
MPLVQGKSKSAFSHNVSAEMHAGKPQAQSVAIAYSEKAKAEHKKHLARGGRVADCGYCMGGYADGGTVKSPPSQPPSNPIGYPQGASWAEGGDVDSDRESMMDQCADECIQAIKSGDKMAFRDALKVFISDVLSKHMDEDEE